MRKEYKEYLKGLEKTILSKDTFDVIDEYFDTFGVLHSSVFNMEFDELDGYRCNIFDKIVSENLFIVTKDIMRKRIAIEVSSNGGDKDTVRAYVEKKYVEIKSKLSKYEYDDSVKIKFSSLKPKTLIPLQKRNAVELFRGKTRNGYRNKIIEILDSEHEEIMQIFSTSPNAPQQYSSETKQENIETAKPNLKPRERQTTREIRIKPDVFEKLKQHELITEDFQWIGDDGSLCAYFLDNYLSKKFIAKWAKGEKLFNVRNLAQAKYNYENTKLGKPKNYKIIDEILGIAE